MVNIEFPRIGGDERQQLQAISTYLQELAGQLNYALQTIDNGMVSTHSATQQAIQAAREAQSPAPGTTFNNIKALIIKSADIVEAYYEEINKRLVSQYVAVSDFGTFRQDVEQQIQETADGIQRLFSNIQEITDAVSELDAQILATNAYIKTGLLYYDSSATPIYGVEIGQQNLVDGTQTFKKFARLTSEKLSFYDANDNEVAYIGDTALHITNAEIVSLTAANAIISTLTMGSYKWVAGANGHLTLT